MKNEKRYILGAGGMGREVLTYYLNAGGDIAGFVEQHSSRSGQMVRGVTIFDETELPDDKTSLKLIAGIGNPLRKTWVEALESRGYVFDTLIHQNVYIGENVQIGAGSIICPGAILTSDLSIGRHCIINVKASISHDCALGDFVTVSPGATIGGRVEIGDGSWIGIGATITQNIKIGSGAFIAAGAVVVDDVPDDSLVMGVPGRVVRKLTSESWETLI